MKVIIDVDQKDIYRPVASTAIIVKGNSGRLYPALEVDDGIERRYLEQGREEGWSLAQMLVKDPAYANVSEIFGVDCQSAVFDMPFEKVLAKAREWEDKYHFVVGDVVIARTQKGAHRIKGVVVNPCQHGAWVLYGAGVVECIDSSQLEKTGDYLEEVNDIFKALKEDK